jgi:D-alanyl-D-alanine carboxypeptidase
MAKQDDIMRRRSCGQIGAFLLVIATATSGAAGLPARQTFERWLVVYNSDDADALRRFNEEVLGEPDAAFVLDSREETGGLDLVRVERSEPFEFVAMMRERNFPALQRVILKLARTGETSESTLEQIPQPLPLPEALASLDAFANRLAGRDRFSGVLMVEQDGRRLYAKAFGLANRETRRPVRLDTPFLIASQGKMFTAVAILQLIESGQVSLDATVGKYLPDYPNRQLADTVTVRHLLTHRGGTGDLGILGPDDGSARAWVRTIDDVIRLNGNRPPAFEPGSREEYSNYGFILLGAIVERVTGQSYYDYLRAHIFRPAGMQATDFPTRAAMAEVAVTYTTVNGRLVPSTNQLPWRGMSAGGGTSSAEDLLKFADALTAGKLISKPLLQEATKRQTPWYGYGFISSPPDEYPHWGHGGGAPGMSLVLAIYPTNGVTIVCLSNRDPPVCDRLFNLQYHLAPAAAGPQ